MVRLDIPDKCHVTAKSPKSYHQKWKEMFLAMSQHPAAAEQPTKEDFFFLNQAG